MNVSNGLTQKVKVVPARTAKAKATIFNICNMCAAGPIDERSGDERPEARQCVVKSKLNAARADLNTS